MALRKLVTLVLVTYVLRRRKFKKLRVLLTTFQVRSQPVVLSFLLLPPRDSRPGKAITAMQVPAVLR